MEKRTSALQSSSEVAQSPVKVCFCGELESMGLEENPGLQTSLIEYNLSNFWRQSAESIIVVII